MLDKKFLLFKLHKHPLLFNIGLNTLVVVIATKLFYGIAETCYIIARIGTWEIIRGVHNCNLREYKTNYMFERIYSAEESAYGSPRKYSGTTELDPENDFSPKRQRDVISINHKILIEELV